MQADGTQNYGQNIAACDIDGDGRLEILASSGAGAGVLVYAWNGSGFVQQSAISDGQQMVGAMSLAAGDVDGDGYCDLLASDIPYNSAQTQVALFLGSASGLHSRPDRIFAGMELVWLAGDLDGDGVGDFVLGHDDQDYTIPRARLVYGGGWETVTLNYSDVGQLVSAAGLGDVDGDGFGDLAVSDSAVDTVYVWSGAALSQGNRTPATSVRASVGSQNFGDGIAGLP
jgi:hypothetical protein